MKWRGVKRRPPDADNSKGDEPQDIVKPTEVTWADSSWWTVVPSRRHRPKPPQRSEE